MEVAATTTTPTHELVPQLQFPPGYRFVPTEEELVDVYLRAKIEGRKLPLAVVNDVSILDWQPGKLVEKYKGYGENRWFFFTVREQSSSNKEKEPSRKVRVDGVTATWKATGSVQLIRRSRRSKDGDGGRVVVGSKRVLIYNSSDPDENGKWSMHEYILKDHAAIGQPALYSIQRKQHSDTQSNDDMDPEKKTTKKRKRTETETPCTELEGVQLPHPETSTTTLLAEPPLKPTRKAKVQRKKKPSMQVGVEGEQQQQQQGQSPMEPVTPPKKEEPVPSSQPEERQQAAVAAGSAPAAADGAPAPGVLSAVPLQAVRVLPLPPSEPDGTLGAPAPTTTEENTLDEMSQLFALLYNHSHHHPATMLCNCNNQGQEQWPPSSADSPAFLAAPDTNVVAGHAPLPLQPYQQQEDGYRLFGVQNQHLSFGENQSIYMEQGWHHDDLMFLMDNTTEPMNSSGSWDSKHGPDQHHQVHQQQQQQQERHNNGGAFGFGVVQDQKPVSHPQGGHDLPPSDEQSSGGSNDLQADSLLFGESVQMDELDAFVRGGLVHRDEPPPQDLAAATQEGSGDDPATVQAAGTQEQGPADDTATLHQQDELQRQLQRALNEHVRDGPCSYMICAAGLYSEVDKKALEDGVQLMVQIATSLVKRMKPTDPVRCIKDEPDEEDGQQGSRAM